MRRTILGAILLVGGLSLLAAPFSGIAGPCWDALTSVEMAGVRGGVTCKWNDEQPCEGHPSICYGCWDHDENSATPPECLDSGNTRYVKDSSEPGFPYCKSSTTEDGFDECLDEKTETICYWTWECVVVCEMLEGTGYICVGSEETLLPQEIHDTFDVDENSGECKQAT